MIRFTFAALLLAVACKNDSSQSQPTSEPPAGSNPHATPGAAAPAAPAAAPAHGGAVAAPTEPRSLEKLADGRVALGPFSMVVPADWTEKPSTTNMRAVQYTLPAPGGGEAEVVVYYFGESGAGSVQANVDRWVSQFKQPDGKPSSEVAKVEKAQYAGQEASIISVSGRFVAGAMPGGAPVDKPNQSLIAAIVPSPRGPYYFRLIGSKEAVAAQEAQFRSVLASLKLAS